MTQSRAGIFLASLLAAVVFPAAPAAGADAEPVFQVDRNTLTPAMEAYLTTVREKIQQRGARDWPEDVAGRKIAGEVVVQITLKKNGYIKELQTSEISSGAADGDNSLSASVEQQVRSAQPYAPFPPRVFGSYELIVFGTSVVSPQGAARPAANPRVDAQGRRERLEMRTRIPF